MDRHSGKRSFLTQLNVCSRAVRVTNFEKLDSAELRELSEEILIQRKVYAAYIMHKNYLLNMYIISYNNLYDMITINFSFDHHI